MLNQMVSKMVKKKIVYENFEEYAKNDKKYFLRSLKGELTKPQTKITFKDYSHYTVTRAGNRWWGKFGYIHREHGPACILHWGREGYYLYSNEYTREEYEEEMKIFHLRPKLEFEFVDINPLIVQTKEYKWINPYISNWYQPEEGSEHDCNVYRIYLKNSNNENIYVYFKSDYLDKKTREYYEQPDWEDSKYSIFKDPYINCQMVYEGLELTLLEDCWGPHPPRDTPYENDMPEYKRWEEESETNQFCFSRIGEIVNAFYKHDVEVDFFSLDCGLTTDGTDWWCDS